MVNRAADTKISTVLAFLKDIYKNGKIEPSSIHSYAVQIQSVLGVKFLNLLEFKRWMRLITNKRGPKPPDDRTFRVKTVLDGVKRLWPVNSELSDAELLNKALLLTAIFFGARPVDISRIEPIALSVLQQASADTPAYLLLDPKNRRCRSDVEKGQLEFRKVKFLPFEQQPELCICSVLIEYISRTSTVRKPDQKLFLYLNGARSLGSEAISKRITSSLEKTGVHGFTARFCKRAGTSALVQDADWQSFLEYGDWKDVSVARQHYDKSVFCFNRAWAHMTDA